MMRTQMQTQIAMVALLLVVSVSWVHPTWAQQTPALLDSLVREGIRTNPALQAVRRRAEAQDQLPPRLGSLPDPVVGFEFSNLRVDDPSLSASPMSGLQFVLVQGIPFPGKLGRRREVANAAALAAWSDVSRAEFDLTAQIEAAYWDYYFTTRTESITRDDVTLLDTLVDIANARFTVGQAVQQDVLKAQVAYGSLSDELLIREQETGTARERLNTIVGRAASTPLGPPESPPQTLDQLQRDRLIEEASRTNPSLIVQRDLVLQSKQQVREASYDRWPDFALSGGYRFREEVPGDVTRGADMFFGGISMTLPIFTSSKQGKRLEESRRRSLEAERQLDDVGLAVDFAVRRLLDELGRLRRQELLYRAEILPAAELALESSLRDYQVAKVEFISVLDNWQRLFDAKITYERVLSEQATTLAELEAIIGRPLG